MPFCTCSRSSKTISRVKKPALLMNLFAARTWFKPSTLSETLYTPCKKTDAHSASKPQHTPLFWCESGAKPSCFANGHQVAELQGQPDRQEGYELGPVERQRRALP